jgi:trk system potassium uptake protein TrkA
MKTSNVLIIGGGEVALNLTKQLVGLKHNRNIKVGVNLMILEKDLLVTQNLMGQLNCNVIQADGTDPYVLATHLENHKADFVIALTNQDTSNLTACFLVKNIAQGLGLKTPKTIARLKRFYRISSKGKECELVPPFKVDHIAYLEEIWAENIFYKLVYPQIRSSQAIYHNHVILLQVEIDERNPLYGMTIRDFKPDIPEKITFCAIKEKSTGIVKLPSVDYVLSKDDLIYLLIPRVKLDIAIQALGLKELIPQKVVIASDDSKLIGNLIQRINKEGSSEIDVISINESESKKIEDEYGGTNLSSLYGDILDDDFIKNEISHNSVYLAAFGSDEKNMASGFKVKNHKVSRCLVVTKNNQHNYIQMAKALGLEHVPNPKEIISQNLTEYLHIEMGETAFEFILTEDANDPNPIQIMEFHVPENSPLISHRIFDIKSSNIGFPQDALIMLLIRNKVFYMPDNELEIQAHDHLLIVGHLNCKASLEDDLLLEFSKNQDKLPEEPLIEHKEEKKKKLFGLF